MLSLGALIFTVQPHLGMGTGDLEWNIARDLTGTAVPNVLSELKFEDVDSVHGGLDVRLATPVFSPRLQLFVEIGGDYGRIDGGDNSDADFAGNNRTGIYSLSESEVRGDHLVEYRGGVGLEFALVAQQHYLALLGGGYRQEQNLNFQDGNQLIADPGFFGSTTITDLNASLLNLDSDYRAEWLGPWLGLQYRWQGGVWSIALRNQWYWATYYGEGRWNLRDDFDQPRSFTHDADATGWRAQLRLGYAIAENLAVDFSFARGQWKTQAGLSTTYFSDNTVSYSRFNSGQWKDSGWRLGLSYSF